MTSAPESAPGRAADFHLLARDGHQFDPGLVKQEIELAAARVAQPRFDDNRGFQPRRR